MKWGEDSDEILRDLHAQGLGRNAISRQMNVAAPDITAHAKRLGLRFGNKTPEAVEARRAAARDKRHSLREDLLNDVLKMQKQMFSESVVFNFGGRDNTFAQETLNQPPTADQLKIAQTIKTLVESIEKLDKMDADADLQSDIGILDDLFAAMQADSDLEDLL